jgi:hypothetical protein
MQDRKNPRYEIGLFACDANGTQCSVTPLVRRQGLKARRGGAGKKAEEKKRKKETGEGNNFRNYPVSKRLFVCSPGCFLSAA